MPAWLQPLTNNTNIVISIILVITILIIRQIALIRVRADAEISVEKKRRLIVNIRNSAIPLLLLALLIVWGSELRSVAISIFAVAAAVVLATKELIMCLSGSVVRRFGHSFTIGDRIEVGGLRGDVIDLNLLTTTIVEIGPGVLNHQYTGRTIVLPNSIYLDSAVTNETFTGMYVLHTFCVPMKLDDDWHRAEERLLEAARAECAPYILDAQRRMNALGQTEGLDVPSVEPRVTLQIPEPERINLLVRIPTPARRKGRIEQAILRRVFNENFNPRPHTSSGELVSEH